MISAESKQADQSVRGHWRDDTRRQVFATAWIVGCALVVVLASLLVMGGWITESTELVQIRPQFAPMQFNTAFGFFLCGAALLCLSRSSRPIALLPGGMAMFLGGLSLLQYLVDADFGIDELFVDPFTDTRTSHPGRMSPGTAVGFILVGATFLLTIAGASWARSAAAVAGGLVVALGLVPLIGYATDLDGAGAWGQVSTMALHTATGFMLVGSALIMHAWRNSEPLPSWLPMLSGFVMTVLVASISYAVHTRDSIQANDTLTAEAEGFAQEVNVYLEGLYSALDRMAERWVAAGGTPRALWIADASAYSQDYPFITSMQWVDVDQIVKWVAPAGREGIGKVFPAVESPMRMDLIKQSMIMREPHVTNTHQLPDGGKGYHYVTPLFVGGQSAGLNVTAINIDALMKVILTSHQLANFDYVLKEGGNVISSSLPAGQTVDSEDRVVVATIQNHNGVWEFSALPKSGAFLTGPGDLSLAVFLVGMFVTVLLFFALRQFIASRGTANALATVMDTVLDGLVTLTDKGKIQSFNASATRIFGYDEDEVTDKNLKTLMPAHCQVEYDQDLRNYFQSGKASIIGAGREISGQRKDGSVFPMELSINAMHVGDRRMFVATIRDVTERNRQQRELTTSEATFRAAMEHAAIGMALIEPDGRFLKVNQSLCAILGYNESELLALNAKKITHLDDLERGRELAARTINGEFDTYSREMRYIHRSGRAVWVMLNVSLVRTAEGTPRYFISQLQDITARREMDEMKAEFVSIVSHELRTPLTSISGSLGLLSGVMGNQLPVKAKHLVDIAHENSLRLVHLINDILDIGKIQSGQQRYDMKTHDLAGIVAQGVETNQAYADGFGVSFDLAPIAPGTIVSVDESRLLQVLANLLSNAAKFSPVGSQVKIFPSMRDGAIRISVKDQGSGVPDEFHSRIFEKFTQADVSVTRNKGGTGLGLHISKQIVEQMGGEIGFDNEIGGGATFWIEFPVVAESTGGDEENSADIDSGERFDHVPVAAAG